MSPFSQNWKELQNQDRHSKSIEAILVVVAVLLTAHVGAMFLASVKGEMQDQSNQAHMLRLALEAPETLREPVRSEFTDEEHYRIALARFMVKGNWASEPQDWQK